MCVRCAASAARNCYFELADCVACITCAFPYVGERFWRAWVVVLHVDGADVNATCRVVWVVESHNVLSYAGKLLTRQHLSQGTTNNLVRGRGSGAINAFLSSEAAFSPPFVQMFCAGKEPLI